MGYRVTNLLTPQQLHDYQRQCVIHQLAHNDSMLWLGMGLGKTPVTLTTIVDRMRAGHVQKTLIFGPLRVIQAVWAREARKWSHTKHLRFSVIHGTKEKRSRALFADADVYLINYEAMNWLAEQLDHYYISQDKLLPFQMVVYDEVSKLKNSTTLRMAGGNRDRKDGRGEHYKIKVTGWRKILPHFKYRTGLTGTPASNGYLDLHGQFLAVDGGERLGEFITHYKDSYFTSDYSGWNYTPTDLGKQWIEHKISDITVKMDSRDYLDLPDCQVTNLMVDLPAAARKAYKEVEKNMFTQLDSGSEVEVFSRSSVSNKCLQFCIAEGTEILTDKGWKLIEHFEHGDKIWDGIKWANVYSLTFQGVKNVIELDGVWMTPDHKVLTMMGWKQAGDIINGDASKRFDRVKVRLPDCVEKVRVNWSREKTEKCDVVSSLCLWERVSSHWSKFTQPIKTWDKILRVSSWRNHTQCDKKSRYDEDQTLHHVDQHEVALSKPKRQRLFELWRSWNRSVRPMVQFFRSILGRYGFKLSESFNDRTIRQRWELLQGKLQMGYSESSIKQQEKQYLHQHPDRKNNSDASGSSIWVQRCDAIRQNKKRMERRTSTVTVKVKKTYDLINAGDLNRFTVRGVNGEIFLAHNCNGSPYLNSESPEFEALHDAKLNALEDILEEAGGSSVLCSYSFRADAERIIKKFKKYKPVNLTKVKSKDTESIINRWNNGEIKLLVAHPASSGHGLDGLQDSGHILVWFGINWSLELYDQINGRINRQGQTHPVSIIRILCNDTIDLAVADAIERKTDDQEGLKRALQRYRDGVTTNDLTVNFF